MSSDLGTRTRLVPNGDLNRRATKESADETERPRPRTGPPQRQFFWGYSLPSSSFSSPDSSSHFFSPSNSMFSALGLTPAASQAAA